MVKVKLLFCAEAAVVDKISNNLSAFNIWEQLNFRSLPVAIPRMVIVSLLEKENGDSDEWHGEIRIRIAGSEIMNHPIEHNFKGVPRSRNIFTIGGVPITQPGKMDICLCQDGNEIQSYTIDISVPEKPVVEVE
ncbi:DUF6941 family protein [Chloroflexota bacterium]